MNMPKIDMSSIVSIFLAIALAFTSMGGLTANIEDTVSFDTKVTLDADAIMALSGQTIPEGLPESAQKQLEDQLQTVRVVGDIISSLTLRGVASKDAAEAVILAGDSVALSIGMKKDDTGVTVASSLLPSDVIFVSSEIIQMMQAQMEQQQQQIAAMTGEGQNPMVGNAQSAAAGLNPQAVAEIIQNLDKEQIAKDIEEAIKKLNEGFEAKKGETETGTFTVDEMTFVSKTPVNMTYPEFIEFLLTGAKELAAKESLKPLMDATGKDVGAEIDKAIEELKKQPESSYPDTFELAVYTDADNCTYSVGDMTKDAAAGKEELHIASGEVEGQNRIKFIRNQGDDKMTISAVGSKDCVFDLTANIETGTANGVIKAGRDEAGNLNVTANINDGKQEARIDVSAQKAEGDRTNFRLAAYFGSDEKPVITFSGSFGKGGELVSVFEGEKITVTPAEKLMDSESSEGTTLGMKMIAGILKIVSVVSKNVPEETGNWINTKIKEAMTPQVKAPEAPQEQPVVDGE